jgi:hypothetical protein
MQNKFIYKLLGSFTTGPLLNILVLITKININ